MSDFAKKNQSSDPSTYMRSRHPDLYSDSESVEITQLSQNVLEYHLETLTNRNQETEFAYFARRLAQKEICPNLRPQTGPVGGGDSKVDSETIPVSTEIAEIWVGADPAAASERWPLWRSSRTKLKKSNAPSTFLWSCRLRLIAASCRKKPASLTNARRRSSSD